MKRSIPPLSPRARFVPPLVSLLALATLTASEAAAQAAPPRSFVLAAGYAERGLHDQAVTEFRRFLEENPDSGLRTEARYRLGVSLVELGKHAEAVAEFGQAANDRGFDLRAECLFRLATAFQTLERPDEARKWFEQMLREVPADHYLGASAAFSAASARVELGDDEGAVSMFRESARRDPAIEGHGFAAPYQAGFALLRLERFDQAEAEFQGLLERFPEHSASGELWSLSGECAARAGSNARALAHYRKARSTSDGATPETLFGLALAARSVGEDEESRAALEQFVQRYGDHERMEAVRLELGRVTLDLGDPIAARKVLTPICGEDSEVRREALKARGRASIELGELDAASGDFESALALGDDAELRFELGEALAERGDWDQALANYSSAIQGATDDPGLRGDALYAGIVALHELGRHEDSLRLAQRFVEELPSHEHAAFARFAVAENLFALERYDAATESYDSLVEDHPDRARGAFMAAWCRSLAGDHAAAASRFDSASRDEGLDDEQREQALSMAAVSYLQAERPDEALNAADRYRARYPEGVSLGRTERVAARVLQARGDQRAAAERLSSAAESVDPNERRQVAIERADALYQDQDFEGALQVYRDLASEDDALGARALEGLAWASFELGRNDAALEAIARGIEHPGTDAIRRADLRHLLVHLHRTQEDWPEVRTAARAFLAEFAQDPRAPEVWLSLGTAEARSGDHPKAVETLTGLLGSGLEVDRSRALYELAWASRKGGDESRAVAAFRQLADLDGSPEDLRSEADLQVGESLLGIEDQATDGVLDRDQRRTVDEGRQRLGRVRGRFAARAQLRLGQSLLRTDQGTEAAAAFRRAAEVGKGSPLESVALFAAGETLASLDRPGEAIEALEAYLELGPEPADEGRARLLLGESLSKSGDAVAAIAQIQAFLALEDPLPGEDEAVVRAARARAQLALGESEVLRGSEPRAVRAFEQAVQLSQGALGAKAQTRIGAVKLAGGDREGAVDAYVRTSILFDDPAWVPHALLKAIALFEDLGRNAEAERFRSELIERFPDSNEAKSAQAGGENR